MSVRTDNSRTSDALRFQSLTCSAPVERTARMADIVLKHVSRDQPMSTLDVGCGTGSLVFVLAHELPVATVTGIDVSALNIGAAEAQRSRIDASTAARVRFECTDYLQRPVAPVDVLTSDGVLHLIPGSTRTLFERLSGDLRPGGTLVACMPYDCGYNYAFAMLRRLLRLVRSRPLDRLILWVGRMLHGREMSDEGLRERVPYMYIAPERLAGRSLRERIAPSVGLDLIARYPMPSQSLSQLRHEVLVFRKRPQ